MSRTRKMIIASAVFVVALVIGVLIGVFTDIGRGSSPSPSPAYAYPEVLTEYDDNGVHVKEVRLGLSDGRVVTCITSGYRTSEGINCDWANAKK